MIFFFVSLLNIAGTAVQRKRFWYVGWCLRVLCTIDYVEQFMFTFWIRCDWFVANTWRISIFFLFFSHYIRRAAFFSFSFTYNEFLFQIISIKMMMVKISGEWVCVWCWKMKYCNKYYNRIFLHIIIKSYMDMCVNFIFWWYFKMISPGRWEKK